MVSFHNDSRWLLKSLLSLLELDYPKERHEIILVNDGSTDGSEKTIADMVVANSPRLRIVQQMDLGPGAARNRGVHESKGDVIAFTDPDCRVEKDWLTNSVRHYAEPAVGGVEGRVETEWEKILYPIRSSPARFRYVTANISYRRKAFDDVGGFDEGFRWKEDDELAYRVLAKGWRIVTDSKAIVHHPIHYNGVRSLILWGLKHQYDVLFYKKHPGLAKEYFKLKTFGPVHVSPELLLTLAAIICVLAAALPTIYFGVFGTVTIPVIAAGLLLAKRKVEMQKPKRSFWWMGFFIFCVELGRLAGSLKFRKFFF